MKGMFMGYFGEDPMHYPPGAGHIALFGPPRSGKGLFFLIRILLTFTGSVFCIDPRGQLAAICARYRRDVLGQDVCVIDAYDLLPEYLGHIRHAHYNVMSKWDVKNPRISTKAMGLMEAQMQHTGGDRHWSDAARLGGAAAAIWVKERGGEAANLVDVYRMVAGGDFQRYCQTAVMESDIEFVRLNLASFASMGKEDRERRDVIQTITTHLGWVDTLPEVISDTTVDFAAHKSEPKTTFVVIPQSDQASAQPFVKTLTDAFANDMAGPKGKYPVGAILDEYAVSASGLTSIASLIAMGAGSGCQLLNVLHDIPELESTPGGKKLLAASGCQIYLPPRTDLVTASHISALCGTRDVQVVTHNFSQKEMTFGMATQSRPAFLPQEIMDMPSDRCIVVCDQAPGYIVAGCKPYITTPDLFNADGTPKFDKDPYSYD